MVLQSTRKRYSGELRHPVLASVRVRIKRKDGTPTTEPPDATEHSRPATRNAVSAIVVEAETLHAQAMHEIPNDSVDAIHGLLAARPALTGERLATAPFDSLKPSPFTTW